MVTVLIADDDEYINTMLSEALTREGFRTVSAYSGTEALLAVQNSAPELILLDLMLPGMSGEEVLKRINGIPVIAVSAKSDIDSKVDVLLGGAADYVTKPFELKELMARIRLRLRPAENGGGRKLMTGELTMDTAAHKVFVNGNELKLTRTEYAILKILLLNRGHAVTKSTLLEKISIDTPDCVETSLKVHISNLRRKIREFSEREYIESVWGIGFIVREDDFKLKI